MQVTTESPVILHSAEEPVVAHGGLHPAHHEGHVVGGEGGEEQVRKLGGAHHWEPVGEARMIFGFENL